MIARLTGQVIEREDRALILDVHGVGYRVVALSSLIAKVKRGDNVTVRIHHQVADDAENLYGFASKEDLTFFQLLITVPSVGPRTAMNILEIAPPPTLRQAITQEDRALLTKVAGVGRKTAERLILELKGKIDAPAIVSGLSGTLQEETIAALTSIGYTQKQAKELIQKLPPEVATVEEAVKTVLKEKVT